MPKANCAVEPTLNSAGADAPIFSLRPEVEILPTSDLALNGQARLVVTGGRYYHLDGLASQLLIALQAGPATVAHLQSELERSSDREYAQPKIEETLNRLAGLSILSNGQPQPTEIEGTKRRSSYFALKIPLFTPRFLQPLTRLLAPMFTPALVACVIPLMLLGQIIFWIAEHRVVPNLYHLPSGYLVLALFAANYAGLFLHELGHAAACVRFGVRHGTVGFALYLVFPALYTDVTDSWRLPRSKRVIVDIGGTYMSLLAATVAAVLFLKFGSLIFAQLCFIYGITVVLNLNPFFRMDGYWVLADIMGLPNLMGANREVTWWLLRFGSRKWGAPPRVLHLQRRLKLTYFAYYLVFIAFTAFAAYYFYAWYLLETLHSLPGMMRDLTSSFRVHAISLHLLGIIFGILLRIIPLLGPLLYVFRYLPGVGGRKSLKPEAEPTTSTVGNAPLSAS